MDTVSNTSPRRVIGFAIGLFCMLAWPRIAQAATDLPAETTGTWPGVTVFQGQRPVVAWGHLDAGMDTHRLATLEAEVGAALPVVPLLVGASAELEYGARRYEVHVGATWRDWAEEEELVRIVVPTTDPRRPRHLSALVVLPRLTQRSLYVGVERRSEVYSCTEQERDVQLCTPRPRDRWVLGFLSQWRRRADLSGPGAPRLLRPSAAVDFELRVSYWRERVPWDLPWSERVGVSLSVTGRPFAAMRWTGGVGWEDDAVRFWMGLGVGGELTYGRSPSLAELR